MQIESARKYIEPTEIFSLRELRVEDLGKAAAKLAKAEPMAIINRQECGMFDYCAVLSGEKVYEVVTMGMFVKCSCPNFAAGRSVCKHIALCCPPYCRSCFKRPAPTMGGQCAKCGPGELLDVGDRFTCKKYFGDRAVLEVVDVIPQSDKVVCEDITLPEHASIPRPKWNFNRLSLDMYRSEGALQIVDNNLGLDK